MITDESMNTIEGQQVQDDINSIIQCHQKLKRITTNQAILSRFLDLKFFVKMRLVLMSVLENQAFTQRLETSVQLRCTFDQNIAKRAFALVRLFGWHAVGEALRSRRLTIHGLRSGSAGNV